MSKKQEKFRIPTVRRQVEFEEEDFRTNDNIIDFDDSLISKKEWQEFDEKALVISDGRDVYQYADEYPIVKYTGEVKSDNGCCLEDQLNTFINSVTVSTVMNGIHFSLKKREMKGKYTGEKTVAYFEDSIGRLNEIPVYDIQRILMKKPNLVVSSDGILVFYTAKECIATIDCVHYAWVDPVRMRMSFKKEKGFAKQEQFTKFVDDDRCYIKKVTACNGFCLITFAKNVCIPYEEELPENAIETPISKSVSTFSVDVKVVFKLDNLSSGMIDYETSFPEKGD